MEKQNKNFAKTIVMVCIFIFFIYFIVKYGRHIRHIKINHLKNYILSFGSLSFLVLLTIYSLKPIFVVVPSMLLTIIASSLYGPFKGFLLSLAALFLSSTLAFYIARSLGKPFVNKLTKGKLLKLDSNIEKYGFKIIFIMRFSTLFPYDALSYAAGLTKMNYLDFIVGSMLGIIPEVIAYSYLGQNIENPLSRKFIIPIAAIFILGLLGSYTYKLHSKRVKE